MFNSIASMSRKLEDQFFFQKDRVLQEQLKVLQKEQESAEVLSKVSGISDKAVLKELVDHDVRPETLAALCLVPIIEVAWADGKVDDKERDAVLSSAKKNGLDADHEMILEWLKKRPGPRLFTVWKKYIKGLAKVLDATAMSKLEADILAHAVAVAEASGRFLGLTDPISRDERKVLREIETFFAETRSR